MSAFPLTQWTVIEAARAGNESAFQELVERYRRPVVRYLASRGLAGEAEDLAQEVFFELYRQTLATVAPERGRFRSLLLAVARNVAGNHRRREQSLKRGGGQRPVPLGDLEPVSREEEEAFERSWLSHLLELALERLEREQPAYYAALRLFLLEGRDYAEVATELGRSPSQIKNQVYRGRKKLAAYLRAEVRGYSATRQEQHTELQLLARLLS